jgi:hypothetical protein
VNAKDFLVDRSPRLGVAKLEKFGGRYTGAIADVATIQIRNRWKQRALEDVMILVFVDGHEAILNDGMVETAIGIFGPETDAWIGQSVTIFLHRHKGQVIRRLMGPKVEPEAPAPRRAGLRFGNARALRRSRPVRDLTIDAASD